MAVKGSTAAIFLVALVLNLGWLWVPVGVAALVLASVAFHRLVHDRWAPPVTVAILVVAWVPYVVLIAGSGMTIGAAGHPLVSIGGGWLTGSLEGALRAFTGAIVPTLAAVGLRRTHARLPRVLATGALATGVVLVPLALWAGTAMGGVPEDADPLTATNPVGPVAATLVVLPFVLAYGFVVGAALAAWRGWDDVPGRLQPLLGSEEA